MAKKKIDITIAAKTKIKGALLKIRQGFAGLGKAALKAGAVAGAALGALAVKAVAAFSAQEDAVNSLNAALRANGHNVEALSPGFQKVAADIQNLTGKADESTIALMAQMANLGIQPQRMEEAAKGAIGLGKALGLSSDAAARYTALAMQGEFTILQRYVPALREATSEAEKQAIVNDLMAGGFQQAQDALKTTSGRWAEFKGRIGDAMEEVGAAIVGNEALGNMLAVLSDKIKVLIESGKIAEWAEIATQKVKAFASAAKDSAESMGRMIGKAQDLAEIGFRKLRGQDDNEIAQAMAERKRGEALQGRLDALKAERKEKERAAKQAQESAKIDADAAEAQAAASEKAEQAAIDKAAAESQAAQDKADAEAALEAERQSAREKAESASEKAVTAANKSKAAIEAETTAVKEQITERDKLIAQLETQAGKSVNQFIAEQKEGKAREKSAKAEARKFTLLKEKQGRGTTLSKKDQLFVDAIEARKGAAQRLEAENIEQQNAQMRLKELQEKRDKIAEDSRKELEKIRENLQKSLNVGGQA